MQLYLRSSKVLDGWSAEYNDRKISGCPFKELYLWMCPEKGNKQTHATNLTKSCGIRSLQFKGQQTQIRYVTAHATEKLSSCIFLNIKINITN